MWTICSNIWNTNDAVCNDWWAFPDNSVHFNLMSSIIETVKEQVKHKLVSFGTGSWASGCKRLYHLQAWKHNHLLVSTNFNLLKKILVNFHFTSNLCLAGKEPMWWKPSQSRPSSYYPDWLRPLSLKPDLDWESFNTEI